MWIIIEKVIWNLRWDNVDNNGEDNMEFGMG